MKKLIVPLALALLVFPSYLIAQTPNIEAKIKSVPPVTYPSEASKTGLEGEVRVVVDVDAKGKVTKVNEAFGPDWVCPNNTRADVVAMRQIAQKAAESAVFVPATKDGKPVASQMRLNFDFQNPSPKKQIEGGLSGTDNSGYRIIGNIPTDEAVKKEPQPSTATTDTKTISGGVLNGSPSSLPKPAYPAAAKALKAKGAVEVQVLVDTNGTIFKAEPISGHPLLRAAARDAAWSSIFLPTLLSGEPVLVFGIITYNFGLNDK